MAAGRLGDATRVDVLVTPEGDAEEAEERAIAILRLFGLDRENVLRRGTTLVLLRYVYDPERRNADVPERDRELVRECLDAPP